MKQITAAGYTRITKRTAERLFNSGATVYLMPCNAAPGGAWYNCPAGYVKAENSRGFAALVNAFSYYNCNSEMGRYPAYYIKNLEV